MVLASASYYKENVSRFASRRRGANTRRQRSRSHHANADPSRSHATREAARRISHSMPIPYAQPYAPAVQDFATESSTHVKPAQMNTSLPRHLQRPSFRAISSTAISAVDHDLKGVPLAYIHQKIHAFGNQMLASAANTIVNCPKGRLPRELEVFINDVSADIPTHLFAVYAQPSALQKQRVSLHPVHAIVLAANCANLPALARSKPTTPDFPGGTVVLPVTPLCIPSPATFSILLDYLYTRRRDHLFASLLPICPREDEPSRERLARRLAGMSTTPALLAHVQRTRDLWSNVTRLGVFDEELWRAMDIVWESLSGALAISSGESWSA